MAGDGSGFLQGYGEGKGWARYWMYLTLKMKRWKVVVNGLLAEMRKWFKVGRNFR